MAKKKYFYPPAPPVGSETFSDDLVGLQLVKGGGLTTGVFEFTPNIGDKSNRNFDLGVFSDPVSLDSLNIQSIDSLKAIVQQNFKVYPNFDFSQITSFTTYGSLQKRISVAVVNVINNFPAGLLINKVKVGSYVANTAFNIEYDQIRDETSFEINADQIKNPLGIDYTKNAKRSIETSTIPLSKYRNFTGNFEKYSIYVSPNESYEITDFEPTKTLNDGTLFFTVKGNPFQSQPTWSETLLIRLNDETIEKVFNEDFDEVEKFLLNRNTTPKYSANFKYQYFDNDGRLIEYEKTISWPLGDPWNIDISSNSFDVYLKDLNDVAENMDATKTNLISRFLTTGSFKDFDTVDQRMEKVLQIYGRSFDETKKFIDSLAYMNSVNYDVGNDIPSQLLKNLALTLGINTNISKISNESLLGSVFNTSSKKTYPGIEKSDTPLELDFQYYRNLILNASYMFKSKGTRHSLEYIMRMIGAPDALVEFNEIVYIADAPININKFEEQYACISGGTVELNIATFDPDNTFNIQGLQYTGYTNISAIKRITNNLEDYGIDNFGYPKSPRATEGNFFQKGSGWFEQTPQHRSEEEIDLKNSSFNNTNPFITSKIKTNTFGQDYMNKYRSFDGMINVGYTLTKTSDNQKSWPSEMIGNRSNDKNFNGVNYKVNNDRLVINSKNIEMYLNMGQGITYDVWETSVKYDYPIPNTPLTAPYPAPGNVDWTSINPKPKEKTFFEFAQTFYNNFINVRNRQTIFDGKTGGYPTLQSVFWRYLQSEETVGIPTNKFTYQKMIDFTLGIGDYWQRLLEQVVPATTLWLTGQKMDNSIFHRQKFVWRRQRGCVFVPVSCIPCKYDGKLFAYDCIDQTVKCGFPNTNGPTILSYVLTKIIADNGFNQNQCDPTSIVSTWFVECKLDNDVLVQEQFYVGYGNNDTPTNLQILNAIDDKLEGLYNYGLNYYFSGNQLVISNSSCYDDFTNKKLYLNIGVDIQINCN
jgi:hypothetical protein